VTLPRLETERLILREVTEADVPSYERHFVGYEVVSQLSNSVPWPYPKGGILNYLRADVMPRQGIDRWSWGIFLKQNAGDMIGGVDLWREAKPENRGFWLGRKFWGRGLMTEAVTPVMDYAFDGRGFEKLMFTNAVGNRGSRRVKEKTGGRLMRTEPARFVYPAYLEREVWELNRDE
jgi:[ribosomal protein S5]-alanine N-acetyltransferase